jgi:hypothetical protein
MIAAACWQDLWRTGLGSATKNNPKEPKNGQKLIIN